MKVACVLPVGNKVNDLENNFVLIRISFFLEATTAKRVKISHIVSDRIVAH